jgi:hypothetical protein
MKTQRIIIIILIFVMTAGPAGAQIVNPDKPLKGKWNFDPTEVWSISEFGNEILCNPTHLKMGQDGRLYFFDFKLFKFFAIDPKTGNLIQAFGQRGQGPGEINYPNDIYPLADHFIVHDRGKIDYFDPHNKYAYLHSTTSKNSISTPPLLVLDPDRYISIDQSFHDPDTPKRLVLHDIPSGSTTLIAGSKPGKKDSKVIDPSEQALLSNYYFFASSKLKETFIAAHQNGRLYFGSNDRYLIHVAGTDGREISSFSIAERKRIPLSKKYKQTLKSSIEKYPAAFKKQYENWIQNGATYFFKIHVDSMGRIYVFVSMPIEDPRQIVDIFSPDGKYLYQGEISFPEGLPYGGRLAFQGDSFFAIFRSALGDFVVKKYRVRLPE